MRFRKSVWDDSEPDYAPCLKMVRGKPYWVPPARFVKAGWETKTVRLDPDNVASECRRLTRDLLRWFHDGEDTSIEPGTWAFVIKRYRGDEFSPIREIAWKTRHEYEKLLVKWEQAIGKVEVRETGFSDIMRWYEAIRDRQGKNRMREAHKMMTMLRGLTSYALKLKVDGARDVKDILGECRFSVPPARTVYPTAAEVDRIVGRALLDRNLSFALGYRMQYDLALRGNDVIGVWEGDLWTGGVTWDMIDGLVLTKTIRKTARHDPVARQWDMAHCPKLVRLLAVVRDQFTAPEMEMLRRTKAPLIVSEATRLPYRDTHWSGTFRRLKVACKLRPELQCRDARAGAISDGQAKGGTVEELRRFAGHSDARTTQRYMRDDPTGKVMKLRKGD